MKIGEEDASRFKNDRCFCIKSLITKESEIILFIKATSCQGYCFVCSQQCRKGHHELNQPANVEHAYKPGPQPSEWHPSNCPPKFSKTCLVVRYNNKLQSFFPPPK